MTLNFKLARVVGSQSCNVPVTTFNLGDVLMLTDQMFVCLQSDTRDSAAGLGSSQLVVTLYSACLHHR